MKLSSSTAGIAPGFLRPRHGEILAAHGLSGDRQAHITMVASPLDAGYLIRLLAGLEQKGLLDKVRSESGSAVRDD